MEYVRCEASTAITGIANDVSECVIHRLTGEAHGGLESERCSGVNRAPLRKALQVTNIARCSFSSDDCCGD